MRPWICALVVAAAGVSRAQTALEPAASFLGSSIQPGVGRGDFEFLVDAYGREAVAPQRTQVRVLVQIPVRTLLEQTQKERAELRLRVRALPAAAIPGILARGWGSDSLSDASRHLALADETREALLDEFDSETAVAATETRFVVEADDLAQLLDTDFRIHDLTFEAPPGDYVVEVLVENLSRTKRGILDRLRKRPLSSVARQLLRVPDLGLEPALADLEFRFGHGHHSPYAARLYGLLNDSLHVHSTLFGHGRHVVHGVARDRSGEIHWRDSVVVEAGGRAVVDMHTSVNTLPAGQYMLEWNALGPQGSAVTARSFDVAWSLVTWVEARRDLDLEAGIALPEEEFDSYRSLPVGEKEKFLADFWRRYDPTPDTAHNEILEEFHRRVAFADLNYSESKRGASSDRGRVYVRYGAPDEVQAEVVPSHLAGEGGEEALQKVDDAYVASEHVDADRVGSTRDTSTWERAVRKQERRRLVGSGAEVVSYELWIYAGGGEPLLPADRGVAIDAGLRVLFVDLEGHGSYRLRKSSVRLNIPGLGTDF